MARIDLAPLRRADGEALIAAHRESRAFHTPWVAPFRDAEGFETFFGNCVTGASVALVARLSGEPDEIVGVFHFSQIVLGNFRSAYLGYWGMVRHAGQGLMTEAMTAALTWAFDEIGLARVEANIQPANAPSRALAERCGFRCEGLSPRYLTVDGARRDHERWAALSPRVAG